MSVHKSRCTAIIRCTDASHHYSNGISSTAFPNDTQLAKMLSANACSSRANVCTSFESSAFSLLWSTTRSSCHILRSNKPRTHQWCGYAHHARMNTRRLRSDAMVAWSFSITTTTLSASSCHPSLWPALMPSSFIEFESTRFLRRSTLSTARRSCLTNRSRMAI